MEVSLYFAIGKRFEFGKIELMPKMIPYVGFLRCSSTFLQKRMFAFLHNTHMSPIVMATIPLNNALLLKLYPQRVLCVIWKKIDAKDLSHKPAFHKNAKFNEGSPEAGTFEYRGLGYAWRLLADEYSGK